MAQTVTAAFNEFLKDTVNLDITRTKNARSSRDWLLSRIHELPAKDSSFPTLHSEKDIYYGSFARRTKKRPLDDVDIMVALNAQGSVYNDFLSSYDSIPITVPSSATNLKALCFEDGETLNSKRVLNKFVSGLKTVSKYQAAEIKLDQVAVSLQLSSYEWNFDVVPCFFTNAEFDGRTYYLIPNGKGHWQKTDPRKDRSRVQDVNQRHKGNILNVIRTVKYWNKRSTMATMRSYLVENMLLNYYEFSKYGDATQFVDIELPSVFAYIRDNIYNAVSDPKQIQGDINNLSLGEKDSIWKRANTDAAKATEARQLETAKDEKGSINKWREIFGSAFPVYG